MKQKRARVERGQGTELSNFRKLTEFYLDTPIVKFVSHVVSTIVVFSVALLDLPSTWLYLG